MIKYLQLTVHDMIKYLLPTVNDMIKYLLPTVNDMIKCLLPTVNDMILRQTWFLWIWKRLLHCTIECDTQWYNATIFPNPQELRLS